MLKRFGSRSRRPKVRRPAWNVRLRKGRSPVARAEVRAMPGSTEENQLVQRYLPLVKTVVGRVAMTLPAHVDVEDLYSAGLVGLLKAIRNFNPKCGTALETYARLRIRGAVLDELRSMDWVPRSVHSKARKVQTVLSELEQSKGGIPTEEEMASALNIPLAEYQHWLAEIRPASFVCLDASLFDQDEDGSTQYESVADTRQEDPREDTSRREEVRIILSRLRQLPPVQQKVLALYYFEGLRLREIAEIFGLTESRICQIHSQAVVSIKAHLQRFDPCFA